MSRKGKNRGEAPEPYLVQYAERLERAEQMLGYEFSDRELLLLALTHPSASEGNRNTALGSYERLEFLG
ncbi:MAG: hypothetical protein LBJ48_02380, partial [Coriobacteriales bacterium]|nr:hypothetical protein [Coriobacteriales bacterium]